jgi:hypothetical protein
MFYSCRFSVKQVKQNEMKKYATLFIPEITGIQLASEAKILSLKKFFQ